MLLIFIIPFCACSSFIDEQVYSVEPELQPYYDMFLTEALNRGYDYYGADVIIKFGDFEDRMGASHQRNDGVKRIEISKPWWDKYKKHPNVYEATFMHEMGHAFLYRDHVSDCNSLMSTGVNCKYENYKHNKAEMLNELFGAEPIE